jgi:hypothetical protein
LGHFETDLKKTKGNKLIQRQKEKRTKKRTSKKEIFDIFWTETNSEKNELRLEPRYYLAGHRRDE